MTLLFAVVISGLLFSGNYFRLGSFELKAMAIFSGAIFFYGFWKRVRIWSKGAMDIRETEIISDALKGTFSKECFFAARLFKKSAIRGIVLIITIWSFMILTSGSMLLSFEYMTGMLITGSSGFSFLMDMAGTALLFCIIFYIIRRTFVKNAQAITVMEDSALLIIFLLIILSGFMVEGLRIAYAGVADSSSFAGNFIAGIFANYDDPSSILKIKNIFYSLHALFVFLFFAYIPFSKQFHMFAAQIVTRDAERRKRELKRMLHD
jgi:nitrate reductase gamma subunit